MSQTIHIVFDGPPGPEGPRFIEVETPDGKSIRAGEWAQRSDGLFELRVTFPIQDYEDFEDEDDDFDDDDTA